MAFSVFVILVLASVFLGTRGNAQSSMPPPAPSSMSKEDFQKWSGEARALLDRGGASCWVLVTSEQKVPLITHDQVTVWSNGPGSTNASVGGDDVCFFCVAGDAVKQIPTWVLLDYLHDKAEAKQAPLRIFVVK